MFCGMKRSMLCQILMIIRFQGLKQSPLFKNNKYFIPLVVDMHRMLGDNNIVPKLRNSSRNDNSRANEHNIRRVEDWHEKEYGIVWKMDDNLRRFALALGKT